LAKTINEEENLSVTESLADLEESTDEKFHILNVALKENYFSKPSGSIQPTTPVIKNVSLQKVKKLSKLRISPTHERLYRKNLEGRDFMKKMSD
jgi:lipopolysaccharide biosynthesis glycosyltransferase